jgi:formaldehyde-activating enzyme involved in methanogenesis
MFKTKKWTLVSLVGVLVLALVISGVWLFAGTSVASAAERRADDLKTLTQSSTGPGLLGEGYLTHGGWGRGGWRGIDYQQLLAEALGITVEELQDAYEAARTAAIEQAVERGLITQEQADEMLVWGGLGQKGFGFFGLRRGPKGVPGGAIDEEALLAEALSITVDELRAARQEANLAAIEQAVEEGIITREQADEMLSHHKLQDYLDRDALLAEALGMTVAKLQAAYADGKTLSDLMSERGLDAATVREKLIEAFDKALAQAVEDGVITQEQADEMQNGRGLGFGWPVGPGGRGGFRGHGGFGGRAPCPPDTDDTSGTRFRHPGRAIQGDSALEL